MPDQIENSMVVDWWWKQGLKEPGGDTSESVRMKLRESGYRETRTNIFVPESEAYEYALERCLNGPEHDVREFREMLVEWFYSGTWMKESQNAEKL